MSNEPNSPAAAAVPTEIVVAGKTWKASQLSMRAIGEIQQWLNQQPRPNTLAELRAIMDGLDKDLVNALLAPVIADHIKWPPDLLFDARGPELVARSPEAMKKVVHLSLKPNHPDLSEGEALVVYESLTQSQFNTVFRVAFDWKQVEGQDPKDHDLGEPATTRNTIGF
jgi:hypothetical protein